MAAHAGSLPHHFITNLAKKYGPIIPMSHTIDNAFVYYCLQETGEAKKVCQPTRAWLNLSPCSEKNAALS